MRSYMARFLMNRIADNGLLRYEWGHNLFGRLMSYRLKLGDYGHGK